MKKTISLILALVLILSLSITAFAAEVPEGESQSIKATYSVADSKAVYKVDIAWGGMVFNYNSGNQLVWDPESLLFVEQTGGKPSWTPAEEGGDTVTVTNHSNAVVNVSIAYKKDATNGVDGTLENGSFTLESADNGVDGAAGTPTSNVAKLSLSTENIPEGFIGSEEAVTLGSLTVTITHPASIDATTADAATLTTDVADALANGKNTLHITLAAEAAEEMFTAVYDAVAASGKDASTISLTFAGVTTLPASITVNADGTAVWNALTFKSITLAS